MPEEKQPSKAPAKKAAPKKKATAKKVAPTVEPVVKEQEPKVEEQAAETVEPEAPKKASKASKTGLVLHLVGYDENAFAILQRARVVLERGDKADLYEEFRAEATSGDYEHLVQTCREYFTVPSPEKE